jgi:hypothetical protein
VPGLDRLIILGSHTPRLFGRLVRALNKNVFFAPPKEKLVLTQQVEPENINGRLDVAATPPAEASSVSNAMPSVKKKVWCSCEAESGSRVVAVGLPG